MGCKPYINLILWEKVKPQSWTNNAKFGGTPSGKKKEATTVYGKFIIFHINQCKSTISMGHFR